MSPYVVPDHVLERNLSTSLTPTFWGTLTVISFDSFDSLDSNPSQLESSLIRDNPLPTQLSASPREPEPENTSTPLSKPIELVIRHRRLYFDDGSITFRVQCILYRLHRSLLCRGSKKFENLLSHLYAQQESTTSPIIPLDDVKVVDFDAFLSILYPQKYDTLERRTFEEWSAILDLSTRWGFTSIRDLAIRCMTPPNPLDRLILARKHAVEEWTLPALLGLCERPKPLSLEEARLMDFEDVVLVGSVRQTIRSSILMVDSLGIGNCIRGCKAASKAATRKGTEAPKPSSGAQTPLAAVPEDHLFEPNARSPPPGGFFVANPDETRDPFPDHQAQAVSSPFSSLGNPRGGSASQNLFEPVTSAFGWGLNSSAKPSDDGDITSGDVNKKKGGKNSKRR